MIRLNINTPDLQRQLERYVAAGRRGMAQAINKQFPKILYEASRVVDQASKPEIRALKKKDWWIKFVVAHLRAKSAHYTKKDVAKYGKAIIAHRLAAVTFLKAYLTALYAAARGQVPKARGVNTTWKRATEQDAGCSVRGVWHRKHRASRSRDVTAKLDSAVDIGVARAIGDMEQYIAKKLNEGGQV